MAAAGAVGVGGSTGAETAVETGGSGGRASASFMWTSSFSGVLRPDGGAGGAAVRRVGLGGSAGFPAASCADAL